MSDLPSYITEVQAVLTEYSAVHAKVHLVPWRRIRSFSALLNPIPYDSYNQILSGLVSRLSNIASALKNETEPCVILQRYVSCLWGSVDHLQYRCMKLAGIGIRNAWGLTEEDYRRSTVAYWASCEKHQLLSLALNKHLEKLPEGRGCCLKYNCNMTNNAYIGANILDGIGIEDVVVGASSRHDVERTFGAQHRVVEYPTKFVEVAYDERGLSFFFDMSEPDDKLKSIRISSPFKGMTVRGIELGVDPMHVVVTKYGRPDWGTSEPHETWCNSYVGVNFEVARDTALPVFPLDEEVHLQKPVIRIVVHDTVYEERLREENEHWLRNLP